MSPAVLIFLPLTLLLLMSKGAGTQSVKPTPRKTTSGKVMGVLTKDGKFVPLASSAEHANISTNSFVLEQNGQRYLVASVND
ncbi:MAG: hypothetical protein AAGA83_18795 [Cyanobacteria bacterium P01_F01_bin.116]